jgi:SAM-dependent methyltransferase
VFCGDFRTALDGRWGTFDAVLLADVLEHVDDDRGFLSDLVARLRPGAVLLITVPANPWLYGPHDVALGHRRRYALDDLRRLWAGLAVEERFTSSFNTVLLPAIAASRLIQKSGTGRSDLEETGGLTNALLYSLFNLESHVVARLPFPAGVSLAAVLRRTP